MQPDWHNGGFGLYLHWPFCQAKCPYCDFNSHVTRNVDQSLWAKAFSRQIRLYSSQTEGRTLNSVFFGGGTPSLMKPETVQIVLDSVRQAWNLEPDCEITMEANPTSVEADNFQAYYSAGVNRLSLGVQALNDPDLRRLGRLHDVNQALGAIALAGEVFDNVSFDLIYARQDQSLEAWKDELSRALSLHPNHISLYQLTIEEGTAFGERFKAGRLNGLPSEDLAADMYEATIEICLEAGLSAYEVSNFSRSGQASRHNRIYWKGGDYAGIGPGAHGRLTLGGTRYATIAEKTPGKWLALAANDATEVERSALDPSQHFQEFLLMGLRLEEGVNLNRHSEIAVNDWFIRNIKELSDEDLVILDDHNLRVTPKGRLVLNSVIGHLASP